MKIKVDVLFAGFSGRLGEYSLGWGSLALVQTEGHNIMFDIGGHAVRVRLSNILSRRGLTFGDIDTVVFSHLHNDHVYNLDFFPHARFLFAKKEWEYACALPRKDFFVEEKALSLLRIYDTRLLETDGEEIFPGISVMFTPGHTPGSMSLVLDQGDEGKWILAGDAVKNRGELRTGDVQMTLDPEASARTLRRVRETASRVLPGHDGWLRVKGDTVEAEGGNDVSLVFGQGVTVNGGQTVCTVHMD